MNDHINLGTTMGPGGLVDRPVEGACVVAPSAGSLARRVALELLRNGHNVTLIHPRPAEVSDLIQRGAHLVCGHAESHQVQKAALRGASALVWIPRATVLMAAPELSLRAARTAAWTCAHARVPRVVVLSLLGDAARLSSTVLGSIRDVERLFADGRSETVVIRTGLFMDHLGAAMRTTNARRVLRLPLPPHLPLPWIARDDVARALVESAIDSQWGSGLFALRGSHDPTALEIALGALSDPASTAGRIVAPTSFRAWAFGLASAPPAVRPRP